MSKRYLHFLKNSLRICSHKFGHSRLNSHNQHPLVCTRTHTRTSAFLSRFSWLQRSPVIHVTRTFISQPLQPTSSPVYTHFWRHSGRHRNHMRTTQHGRLNSNYVSTWTATSTRPFYISSTQWLFSLTLTLPSTATDTAFTTRSDHTSHARACTCPPKTISIFWPHNNHSTSASMAAVYPTCRPQHHTPTVISLLNSTVG